MSRNQREDIGLNGTRRGLVSKSIRPSPGTTTPPPGDRIAQWLSHNPGLSGVVKVMRGCRMAWFVLDPVGAFDLGPLYASYWRDARGRTGMSRR